MTTPNYLGGFKVLRGQLEPGQCPECATKHTPEMPHNQQSLFYQYTFYEKHGRWPTWNDALAHCTPEMRDAWVEQLATHGVIVPPLQDIPEELQKAHQYLYYVLSRPIWTDTQYDDFCREHKLQGGGGSDCAEHYSPQTRRLAQSLLIK